jgi:hypothetical protein
LKPDIRIYGPLTQKQFRTTLRILGLPPAQHTPTAESHHFDLPDRARREELLRYLRRIDKGYQVRYSEEYGPREPAAVDLRGRSGSLHADEPRPDFIRHA